MMGWQLGSTVMALTCVLSLGCNGAHAEGLTSAGQLLYVPVYSELAYGDRKQTLNLSVTLSVRNTDRRSPLTLTRVDYFNSSGERVRAYLAKDQTIAPLASIEYVVTGGDRSGGTAASFLVEWNSAARISAPVVEAVMVSAASTHGVSFQSAARVLEERN
jgi:hypothetical protein